MKCILCKGTGEIIEPRNYPDQLSVVALKRKAAQSLRKENFSIRQIRDLLGYKSIKAIQNFLEVDKDIIIDIDKGITSGSEELEKENK